MSKCHENKRSYKQNVQNYVYNVYKYIQNQCKTVLEVKNMHIYVDKNIFLLLVGNMFFQNNTQIYSTLN